MKLVKSHIALRRIVTAPSHKRLQSFVALLPRVTGGSFPAFATLRFSRPIPAFLPRLPRQTDWRPGQACRPRRFADAASFARFAGIGPARGGPRQRPDALRGAWAPGPFATRLIGRGRVPRWWHAAPSSLQHHQHHDPPTPGRGNGVEPLIQRVLTRWKGGFIASAARPAGAAAAPESPQTGTKAALPRGRISWAGSAGTRARRATCWPW